MGSLLQNFPLHGLKWSGLAKSADTSWLYFPKVNDGLHLPVLTTMYKKLQAAKAATYQCSRDSTIRKIGWNIITDLPGHSYAIPKNIVNHQ